MAKGTYRDERGFVTTLRKRGTAEIKNPLPVKVALAPGFAPSSEIARMLQRESTLRGWLGSR